MPMRRSPFPAPPPSRRAPRACLLLVCLLAACGTTPPPVEPQPPAPAGEPEPPRPQPAPAPQGQQAAALDLEALERDWRAALASDFWRHCQGCRRLVARGEAVLPFLESRLADRREVYGQRIELAAVLVQRVLVTLEDPALEALLKRGSPFLRGQVRAELDRRREQAALPVLMVASGPGGER